ncbi:glycosyltransferase WbuB [Variovorax dokdonensis]|uniref:Glycosyltransferase WbuB n=1 Tax=Variovorax dokdonensis TaxID=344883 RepID=A0ABT7N6L7_9BURK|nr:glycosyltransferase WbuB [Variovorax dokdonensis]MDM0043540.1 glycosyltransferase WbuB [Variovorax dokdonensis]
MKVLLYGINFAPELTGIGKYTGEMAQWLAAQGHEVRVVTAPPYYPAWSVSPGYSARAYRHESWQGVDVHRTPLWVPAKPTGLKRLLHLISFAIASGPALLAQWRWKPDVVWMAAPAFACAPGALALARLVGAPAWIHIQDYEVDAAFQLGLLKGERLRNAVSAVERALLRRFDRVSTISGRMLDRAREKGVRAARLRALPNWVDILAVRPLDRPSSYRAELGIATDAVVALYSGNMGAKQGLEVLADLARKLQHRPDIQFVYCGEGSGRAPLEQACQGLPNVRFLDLQPLKRLPELLGLADIHLLPQRADAADLVMPSKLTGMLSSGRAVVAGARPETELGQVVAKTGMLAVPDDAQSFAEAVQQLADQPDRRRELGLRARQWAEENLSRDAVLRQFEADLHDCVGALQPSRA